MRKGKIMYWVRRNGWAHPGESKTVGFFATREDAQRALQADVDWRGLTGLGERDYTIEETLLET